MPPEITPKEVNDGVSQIAASVRRPNRIEAPEGSRFIEITKPNGFLLGSRWVSKGEVIAIAPGKPSAIWPVDDHLYEERAQKLIEKGLAKSHTGPATHKCERMTREEVVASLGIEFGTSTPADRGAAQAVAPRQKAGGAI